MVIEVFRELARQLILITLILALCFTVTFLLQGRSEALALLETTVVRMKGPWVWTFGWGLVWIICRQGRQLPATLNELLRTNDVMASVTARMERSTLHRHALPYTIPITALGIGLTYAYGIPHSGAAFLMILVGISSIYYAGAFILFHLIEVTMSFHHIFKSVDRIEFQSTYSPLHLENLTSYLALTTTLGLIAVYAGFRGTLTAGFELSNEIWRVFLSTPLILFLPGTLFFNYYPRFVLRKIVQHKVLENLKRLGTSNEFDTRSIILEMKESVLLGSQILPFVDYKSLPSYIIAVVFASSFVYNSDPEIRAFFSYFLDINSN